MPTLEQLQEAVQRGKAEELSAEAARREQAARRKRELEELDARMEREWYSDDPQWQAAHRNVDEARDEQLAARKYQEQREREQNAYDLSTQAAIDEKTATKKFLELSSSPKYNYNREAAVDYAIRHAYNPNPEFVDYSKLSTWLEYALKNGVNAGLGDCANFVSQSMNAGGIGKTDVWHGQTTNNEIASVWRQAMTGGPAFEKPNGELTIWPNQHDYTGAWARASDLFQFCSDPDNNCSEVTLYFSGSKDAVAEQMRKASGLIRPGDLLFWDADRDGLFTHATIITGFESDGTPKFSGHSSQRRDEVVSSDGPWKSSSQQTLAVVRMRDSFNMNGG